MERKRDILIRFWFNTWNGRMPDALWRARGEGTADVFWRDDMESGDDAEEKLPARRLWFEDLKNASPRYLFNDLEQGDYFLSRVHLHEVTTARGKKWRVIMGFTCDTEQAPYSDDEVVDWIEDQFIVNGDTQFAAKTCSITIPREDGPAQHAIIINFFDPKKVNGAPVMYVRQDDEGFWIEHPTEVTGDNKPTTIEVEHANLLYLQATAPERAKNDAGEVANRTLKAGYPFWWVKILTLKAAYTVFRVLVDGLVQHEGADKAEAITQAQLTAVEVRDAVKWDGKLKRFQPKKATQA